MFFKLVDKRYPLKAVQTLKRKKKEREREREEEEEEEKEEEEANYSLQTEPTWEHEALSGTD